MNYTFQILDTFLEMGISTEEWLGLAGVAIVIVLLIARSAKKDKKEEPRPPRQKLKA